MSVLLRFVLEDGVSIVTCCDSRVERRPPSTAAETAPVSSVTFVSDTAVEFVPMQRLRAILPVESAFQIPSESSVFRFALLV